MKEGFNSETLHDAILRRVTTDWQEHTCRAEITLVGGRQVSVVWAGVGEIAIPHASPWGDSPHINAVRTPCAGTSEIEMQSGDVIMIRAETLAMK